MKQPKYRLTTTLELLRKHGACQSGYRTLRKSLGADWPKDKPINLLRILESNSVQDMCWCLRATREDSTIPRVAIAADFAKSVLKYFTEKYPNDKRVSECIETCFAFVRGKATIQELKNAAAAAVAAADAYAAAYAAAAASAAVAYAAYAAASAAVAYAAASAASAAADAAASAAVAYAAAAYADAYAAAVAYAAAAYADAYAAAVAYAAAAYADAYAAAVAAVDAAASAREKERTKQARIIRKWLR